MNDGLNEIDIALLEIIQKIAENHGLALECYLRRLVEKVTALPDRLPQENANGQ